ncbi:unnamed protein product [Heterobilharzia americana]|nr:unnamed protein product [Heterobilharzia americana]
MGANNSRMDLFAGAPLAPFEVDSVYDDLDGSESSSLVADASNQIKKVLSIPFEGSFFSFEDSLTDLVGNFDEKIYHCFENFDFDPENNQSLSVSTNVATLNEVKQWWAAATTELVPSESYPLQNLPTNINSYDLNQFELADADGITEDEIIKTSLIQKNNVVHYSNESVCSARGTVTTLSLSSISVSPRSLTLDRVSLTECSQTPVVAYSSTDNKANVSSSFSSFKKTQSWIDDLQNLQVSVLRLYVQQMSSEIMQLSDCLVDSLAERDELSMLREASDDFIVLLSLVHERKSRASKAALLATAKNLIRSKTLFRVTPPWFTRRCLMSASSTFSLNGSLPPGKSVTMKPVRNESVMNVPANSVHLDLENNSVAYVASLNLHSKLRRPRTQPIPHIHVNNCSNTARVSNSPANSVDSKSPGEPLSCERIVLSESIPPMPVRQAKIRYEALVNMCNSTNWPNGKPQNSRSLLLRLPYRIHPSVGISIQDLRLLNQILYATVLENPKIEKLLESYIMHFTNTNNIANWVKTVEAPRYPDSQKIKVTSCQDQSHHHLLQTSMQTQCV